jgi:hypothetical protein
MNMPKQPGDAVLSRNGTVKVDGDTVGVWWLGQWPSDPGQGVMPMYYFALAKDELPAVTAMFRHQFKAAIPQYLKLPHADRPAVWNV